tara:strand:- start:73 stop:402 length:330 start_codon:yes stop_codon:yes gene_type:complete
MNITELATERLKEYYKGISEVLGEMSENEGLDPQGLLDCLDLRDFYWALSQDLIMPLELNPVLNHLIHVAKILLRAQSYDDDFWDVDDDGEGGIRIAIPIPEGEPDDED